MLDHATAEEIRRQVMVAVWKVRRRPPFRFDDLIQTGWVAALKIAHKYDPHHPGARGYFVRAALLACYFAKTRERSAFTITLRMAERGEDDGFSQRAYGLERTDKGHRASRQNHCERPHERIADTLTPETWLLLRERSQTDSREAA